MGEPDGATGADRLTDLEIELLECLNGCGVVSHGYGGAAELTIDDFGTFGHGRRHVEWLVDASAVVWLLELGAGMAATGEGPAMFDRAAFLLGWRPDDEEEDERVSAPVGGGG